MICDIEVSDEASMVVTTPGATRSHYMRSGLLKWSKNSELVMVRF